MISLPFLAEIKEVVVGGATYDILYNVLYKEIITMWGLDSYTTCRFHKYGCPNNTSQTSNSATSHNTSSVKGLMLSGRRHYWQSRRSCPWWSHLMLYNCGCGMVGSPSGFMTSVEMRFFWLPLSTMNYSGEPFTHIWEWKRCPPPPLDLQAHSSRPWQWQLWHWAPHKLFSSLFHSPCRVLTQGQNMHLILKPSTRPPTTAWSDTYLCYEWGSYGTHNTFLCPSLTSWCCYFLAASKVCLGSPRLGFVLCSSDS